MDCAEAWPRGTTPHPRSGAATESARLCWHRRSWEELPHVRGQGSGREELPDVQGVAAAQAKEGRDPADLPDPGMNQGLLHCGQILYQLSYQGSPLIVKNNLNIRLLILDSMEFILCLLFLYLCNEIERTLKEYFSKIKTNGIWEKKSKKRKCI